MPARILFVDDDPLHLKVLARTFRSAFDVMVAHSGQEAMDLVLDSPPFAVVVADMHMPGMDGVALFKELKAVSPETTRIMLTGQTDQATAVEAVNSGSVFRFLAKPCDEATLMIMVEAGVHQYDLVCANRILLEETLSGSIQVLVDLLSVFDPRAFGQAQQTRDYALAIAARMGLPAPLDLGLAALLAPVGRMALPLAIQSKLNWGEPLAPRELEVFHRMPETGARIVGNIPRLQSVARIIKYSGKHFNGGGYPQDDTSGQQLPLEARILRVVVDFMEGLHERRSKAVVLEQLRLAEGLYDPEILAALELVLAADPAQQGPQGSRRLVALEELEPGMCLVENLATPDGALVLAAGTRLAQIHLERLRSVAAIARLVEPVLVEV
jgi:response regulator RpfG family c-di-GMP phosphodiesterase